MNSVHVVAADHFTYQLHQILFGGGMSGVEEIFVFIRHADVPLAFGYRLFAE